MERKGNQIPLEGRRCLFQGMRMARYSEEAMAMIWTVSMTKKKKHKEKEKEVSIGKWRIIF